MLKAGNMLLIFLQVIMQENILLIMLGDEGGLENVSLQPLVLGLKLVILKLSIFHYR